MTELMQHTPVILAVGLGLLNIWFARAWRPLVRALERVDQCKLRYPGPLGAAAQASVRLEIWRWLALSGAVAELGVAFVLGVLLQRGRIMPPSFGLVLGMVVALCGVAPGWLAADLVDVGVLAWRRECMRAYALDKIEEQTARSAALGTTGGAWLGTTTPAGADVIEELLHEGLIVHVGRAGEPEYRLTERGYLELLAQKHQHQHRREMK